ncbi:MAG: hypothetical protein WCA13_16730 [Terriglobales bacterium]
MMTTEQDMILRRLRSRIKQKLEIDEYGGEVFTENQGVTVKIGLDAGIEVPSLRSYDDPFEAAVDAGRLFRLQQERDDENPERAEEFKTGHFNPRWDPRTRRCIGNRKCPRCKH